MDSAKKDLEPTPLATLAKDPDFSYGVWLLFDSNTAVLSLFYPAVIVQDPKTQQFMVEFVDIPHVYSTGDTCQQALSNAADALETAVNVMMECGESIPKPSNADGLPAVSLSAAMAEKVARYNATKS